MLAILGGGSFAREVYWHIQDVLNNNYRVSLSNQWLYEHKIVFVDTVTSAEFVDVGGTNVPVYSEVPPGCLFVMGLADPEAKQKLVELAVEAGATPAPAVIHPSAVVQSCNIGMGVVICPNVTVTTNVSIGDYVTVNCNSVIGHDTRVGDYTTINPLVMVSGGVVVGESCFLGASSFIREKLTLAPKTTVGASACVVKNSQSGDLLTGVPAKPRV